MLESITKSNSTGSISNLIPGMETLQEVLSEEYRFVIEDPEEDFHFHTGRPLARTLDYAEGWWTKVPPGVPEATPKATPGKEASGHRSPLYEMAREMASR